ncbi:MAG: ImmA/IrrE family metallo-endopeptidase [Campylobacterales bacterium]
MNNNTVFVKPDLIVWARERAGLDELALAKRFPKLAEWETGKSQPTLKQLEDFAHAVHVPIGYLFLPEPMQETLPIPDFRTLSDRAVRPSPDLLDTLYLCQQRQDWFRDYTRLYGFEPLDFVGSVTQQENPVGVAEKIRQKLNLSLDERRRMSSWGEALSQFVAKAETIGVLVMVSSVVGSNSHRKLRIEEFRGFALADDRAPLIFLNASDSKAAQMFTLAHELAHLWLGQSGVSNTETGRLPERDIERWCNTVAAEVLMPLAALREAYRPEMSVPEAMQHLAKAFKVSTLVALRRLFDARIIDETTLWQHYREELMRIEEIDASGGNNGGNFYNTLGARIGKRFARAVLASTLEGQTLFQEAYRLLGVRKNATFYKAARELKVLQ